MGGMELLVTEIFRPDRGDRPSVPNVALVVTATEADRRQNEMAALHGAYRLTEIQLLIVGITEGRDVNVDQVAGATAVCTEVFLVPTFQDLGSVMHDLVDQTCGEEGTTVPWCPAKAHLQCLCYIV